MTTVEDRKKALETRLNELEARLHGIEDELESHAAKDWEELAVEREEDEVLEDIGTAGVSEIARIRAALDRIEAGTYGICVKCGDTISQERLDVLPATPFCSRCAT